MLLGGQNLLSYHPARRFDERLVVLLRIYFWKYSDDCMIRSTSTCGEQRGMVYINVIKVSLIPRRELHYVVKTEKGERPSGELIKISRY